MIETNYFYFEIIVCFQRVIWSQVTHNNSSKQFQLQETIINTSHLLKYQVFLSTTNNFQTYLFDPYIGF